jgi:sporulation protein YlmC with PRC-barrel domain
MEIELGKPVVGSDGRRLGDVDGLVLDSATRELRQIVLREKTFLAEERVVDRSLIARVDPDATVHLTIGSEQIEQLPLFAEDEYVLPKEQEELRHLPQDWIAEFSEPPLLLWGPTSVLQRRQGAETREVPETIETPSNLPPGNVSITGETQVISSDGQSLGTVHEAVYDAKGDIEAIVIRAGILFSRHTRIPADWIESITSDTILLRVSTDEAQRRAGLAES